jgi:thiamine-phosphate pyrophosphorylase
LEFNPTLYFVTPEIGEDLMAWGRLVQEAVEGGVTLVQLRDKRATARQILSAAETIQPFLQARGVPLLINDRVDIAHAARAAGVHLGQSDLTIAAARKILGPDALIGVSIETMEQLQESRGADYVAASPLFATPTKTDTAAPWGLERLKELRQKVEQPLVAIGGIKLQHLPELIRLGIDGVAIVSAIAHAKSPKLAAREFMAAWVSGHRGIVS